MASLASSDITVPIEVANDIWAKTMQTSVLARLSGQQPQKFGESKIMTLVGDPKAELVGEGADKSPTPVEFGVKTVTPRKVQVTIRMNDEVKWADEDYQLEIWNTCVERGSNALGRALDLIGIHRINPLTGAAVTSITDYIAATTNSHTLAAGHYAEAVEAAAGLIVADGFVPTGIAMDPTFSFGLATQRDNNNVPLNPGLGFGQGTAGYMGMAAAVSNTVSAPEAATATNLHAIVGDFGAFRWGVQRDIGAHVIEYGDPDGLGDLQRKNQIALRMEIVYGIAVMDLNAFAKVITA